MGNGKFTNASLGLRAKTARAIAVILTGPVNSPHVIMRAELGLTDPNVPATSQPYHEVLDLPWDQAKESVREIAALVEAAATGSLAGLLFQARERGLEICCAGIVGAGERNLEKIGSSHIRAHAAEGVLFRRVLEVAAERNKLVSRTLPERDMERLAGLELGRPATQLNKEIAEMGRSVGRPWRADEKAAATAAWMALKAFLSPG
jgi:hypothetical protein